MTLLDQRLPQYVVFFFEAFQLSRRWLELGKFWRAQTWEDERKKIVKRQQKRILNKNVQKYVYETLSSQAETQNPIIRVLI